MPGLLTMRLGHSHAMSEYKVTMSRMHICRARFLPLPVFAGVTVVFYGYTALFLRADRKAKGLAGPP